MKSQACGILKDIKVIDLSRVLAGPASTQILGDMGADVVKVEQKGSGDDTRKFGPPFLKNDQGEDTTESAFYLSANRNKRSIALDFKSEGDLKILADLIAEADILVENFKVGNLKQYGLDYQTLKLKHPKLIYCSITGYGQTGPYKDYPGYDFLIQATSGIMSITGEKDGSAQKVGVGVADLMSGMYATSAILGALYERTKSGQGQYIDISLLDCGVALLSYVGQYCLTSGELPPRQGNAHATIVPYQSFKAKDQEIVLGVGNDNQFQKFCSFAGRPELSAHPDYATNQKRVKNRSKLVPIVEEIIAEHPGAYWVEGLNKAGIPCSPINTIPQIFNDPQIKAREMAHEMPHPLSSTPTPLIASPLNFSRTPVSYRYAPPPLNQDADEILSDWLANSQKSRYKI